MMPIAMVFSFLFVFLVNFGDVKNKELYFSTLIFFAASYFFLKFLGSILTGNYLFRSFCIAKCEDGKTYYIFTFLDFFVFAFLFFYLMVRIF